MELKALKLLELGLRVKKTRTSKSLWRKSKDKRLKPRDLRKRRDRDKLKLKLKLPLTRRLWTHRMLSKTKQLLLMKLTMVPLKMEAKVQVMMMTKMMMNLTSTVMSMTTLISEEIPKTIKTLNSLHI